MRELEPVAGFRVVVPEPGDILLFCSSCGGESGMIGSRSEEGLAEAIDATTSMPSTCCQAPIVLRHV